VAVYLAFLQGINVGSGRRIKMDDLCQVFLDLDFAQVQTYIQSGNVIFTSLKTDEMLMASTIYQAVQARFGFPVKVILRPESELAAIADHCPFSADFIARSEAAAGYPCLHVAMLAHYPADGEMDQLVDLINGGESCQPFGRNAFLFLPQGFHTSKLPRALTKIDPAVTFRNWKTVTYLTVAARPNPADA
jgi:uncharacterized protein (DUF1697 family)